MYIYLHEETKRRRGKKTYDIRYYFVKITTKLLGINLQLELENLQFTN